jgi:hypothetical protein
MCTRDMTVLIADYIAAWKRQDGIDREMVIFIDNGHRFVVPCSSTEEDESLMYRLRTFHSLMKIESSILELCGPKSSQRIDIVEVIIPLDLNRRN